MMLSILRLRGQDFNARAAAWQLGLRRDAYILKGERVKHGPMKGKPQEASILSVVLADSEDPVKHVASIERALEGLSTFICKHRRRCRDRLDASIDIGLTVGHPRQHFTRSVMMDSPLLTKLAALGIRVCVSAYPASD